MIRKLSHGIAVGLAFVLPGLSAGTVILILGFYREFVEDISRFRLLPYLPHMAGAAVAILGGARLVGYLMEHYYDLLMSLLLGMLVASVYVVIRHGKPDRIRFLPFVPGAAGFLVAWFILCNPSAGFFTASSGSLAHFFAGGAAASATMLLPGISGGAVLIILNLYDDVIIALNNWQWVYLSVFAVGAVTGFFALARLLTSLYRRHTGELSFFLAGLILGSTRALLPSQLTFTTAAVALAGVVVVVFFSWPRKRGAA